MLSTYSPQRRPSWRGVIAGLVMGMIVVMVCTCSVVFGKTMAAALGMKCLVQSLPQCSRLSLSVFIWLGSN